MSFAAASPRRGTYGSEASAQSLRKLKDLGVDWISLMPFERAVRTKSAVMISRTAARVVRPRSAIGETPTVTAGPTDQVYPAGVRVNTYSIRRDHVDLRGDGTATPLSPIDG